MPDLTYALEAAIYKMKAEGVSVEEVCSILTARGFDRFQVEKCYAGSNGPINPPYLGNV
jgi:hypothetical protein